MFIRKFTIVLFATFFGFASTLTAQESQFSQKDQEFIKNKLLSIAENNPLVEQCIVHFEFEAFLEDESSEEDQANAALEKKKRQQLLHYIKTGKIQARNLYLTNVPAKELEIKCTAVAEYRVSVGAVTIKALIEVFSENKTVLPEVFAQIISGIQDSLNRAVSESLTKANELLRSGQKK